MKKIIVLIAILSLAACAGGTGGGSVSVNPDDGTITITPNQPDNGNNTGGDNNQNDDTSDNNDNGNTQDDNQNNNDDNNSSSDDNENTCGDNNQNDDQNNGGDTQTDNQDDNSQINNPGDNIPDTPVVPVDILNPDMLNNLADINDAQNMFSDFDYKFTFDDEGNVISFQLLDEGDESPLTLQRQGLDTRRFIADRTLWYFDVPVCFSENTCIEFSLEDLDREYTNRDELASMVRTEMERKGYSEDVIASTCNLISTDSTYGTWESVLFKGDFYTLGKANGLRYSDFGHFTLDDYAYSFVYHGGIEDKKIDPSTMQSMEPMVFNGSAAAQLQHSYERNGIDTWEDEDNSHGNRLITTNQGDATLTFANGTEILNMPFNGWYTVNVVKTGDIANRIDFTNGNNIPEDWRVINEHVVYDPNTAYRDDDDRLTSVNWSSINNENNQNYDRAEYTSAETEIETIYYGDNHIPSEVTGFINHVDEHDNYEHDTEGTFWTERTIWFDAVFGGTKD